MQAAEGVKPLLIYRATIHLAVFEARKSIDQVEALAKELGGYLVERTDLGITVRVPAGDFDGALETISKVGDEQLFYLQSRGIDETEATKMIVNGFVEPIVKELPMEYALELNRLIELQMEGSVG